MGINRKEQLEVMKDILDKLYNHCESVSDKESEQIVNDDRIISKIGIINYSTALRSIDGDDEDLKYVAQQLFMALGTPVTNLNNEVVKIEELMKTVCELKKFVAKIKA